MGSGCSGEGQLEEETGATCKRHLTFYLDAFTGSWMSTVNSDLHIILEIILPLRYAKLAFLDRCKGNKK